MKTKTAPVPEPSVDRGLGAFQAGHLFPGRVSVRVPDVARALGISDQQVVDLIEEYRDTDGASGLAAVNVARGLHDAQQLRTKTARSHWRIPVAAFDAFVNARKNNQPFRVGDSAARPADR